MEEMELAGSERWLPRPWGRKLYLGLLKKPAPLFYDNHVLFVWKKTKLEKYSIWAPSLPEAACTHAKSTRGGQISRFFALFMTSVAVTVLLRFFLHEIILSRK